MFTRLYCRASGVRSDRGRAQTQGRSLSIKTWGCLLFIILSLGQVQTRLSESGEEGQCQGGRGDRIENQRSNSTSCNSYTRV
jgi:hypothetical protein